MVKVDLITGFLGSGKTTFIRKYAAYLLSKGERICILENDHGAVNVDMMLLSDLKSDDLGIEMVAGGCDHDCHKRRFKTKLITMAMLGYDRVLIEPSGVFDVDEFFDILHEDPLDKRYKISNVITIVKADIEEELSPDSDYMLASQTASAGVVVLSRTQCTDRDRMEKTVEHINRALRGVKCKKRFGKDDIITKPWDSLTEDDFLRITCAGYRETAFEKRFSMDDNGFKSLFFMNCALKAQEIIKRTQELFEDSKAGNVIRVKGFAKDDEGWVELNATREGTETERISAGQEIIIVIGEKLDEKRIEDYYPAKYSTNHVGSRDAG